MIENLVRKNFSELDNSNKSLKINVKNGISDAATTNKFSFLVSTSSLTLDVDLPLYSLKYDSVSTAVIESLTTTVSA